MRWSYYCDGPITEVVLLLRSSYYGGAPITELVLLLRWSFYRGSLATKALKRVDIVVLYRVVTLSHVLRCSSESIPTMY